MCSGVDWTTWFSVCALEHHSLTPRLIIHLLQFTDTPPGTSDEHISGAFFDSAQTISFAFTFLNSLQLWIAWRSPLLMAQSLSWRLRRLENDCLDVVHHSKTFSSQFALPTIRKEITFCHKMGIRVLGIVDNMSKLECPCCEVSSAKLKWCCELVTMLFCIILAFSPGADGMLEGNLQSLCKRWGGGSRKGVRHPFPWLNPNWHGCDFAN